MEIMEEYAEFLSNELIADEIKFISAGDADDILDVTLNSIESIEKRGKTKIRFDGDGRITLDVTGIEHVSANSTFITMELPKGNILFISFKSPAFCDSFMQKLNDSGYLD